MDRKGLAVILLLFAVMTPWVVSCGPGLRLTAGSSSSQTVRALDSSWIDTSSLVFYLKFDESSQIALSTLTDSIGNLTGSLFTGDGVLSKAVTGRVGTATYFDGNDYLSVTDPGATALDHSMAAARTYVFWVKPAALPIVNTTIMTKGGTAGTSNHNWAFQNSNAAATDGTVIGFYLFDNGSTWMIFDAPSGSLQIGVWTHVAFVYTMGTAASAKFYINGVLVAGAWSGGGSAINPPVSNDPLMIGKEQNPGSHPFNGTIDEFAIINRALTAAEIQTIYDRQK